MKLHHLAIGARDPDAVAAFYRDVLGLEEVKRHVDDGVLRSVWLRVGDAVVMVERIGADTPHAHAPEGTRAKRAGLFLLALAIDAAERPAWRARLDAAGCPVEDATDFTDYTRDPEGNRVALSFYPLGL